MNDIYNDLDQMNNAPSTFDKEAWGERKKAERTSAYDQIESTVTAITQESGKFQSYLDVQSRMDRYSVGNTLLIFAQMPNAQQLKDYNGWQETGTKVRPRQRGVTILEPGSEYTREDGSIGISYNTKKVFDISQTFSRARNVAAIPQHNERNFLKAIIETASVPVRAASEPLQTSIGAFYDPDQDSISIQRGLDTNEFFLALSHELAHAHFASIKGDGYVRSDEGFHVYCTAYMLCKRYGIDTKDFEFTAIKDHFQNQDSTQIRDTLGSIRNAFVDLNDRIACGLGLTRSPQNRDQER